MSNRNQIKRNTLNFLSVLFSLLYNINATKAGNETEYDDIIVKVST